jgi:hypothetical protein
MLPEYDELKSRADFVGGVIKEAKSDGKVTLAEAIKIVVTIGFNVFEIGEKAGSSDHDMVVSWCKDIIKKLYHDPDVGINVDIPVLFEPAETWFENIIIDSIIDTVADLLFKRKEKLNAS